MLTGGSVRGFTFSTSNCLLPLVRPETRWLRHVRRCSIRSILSHDVPEPRGVTVKGWAKSIRRHKGVSFVSVSDGSSRSHLQVVIPSDKISSDLTFGSCVQVQGILQASHGKGQSVEVLANDVIVLGPCNGQDFPLKAGQQHSTDYVRQYLHLRPRTTMFSSLLRLRSAASHAFHDFFKDESYLQVHTPILTSNDCEGAGEVFSVKTLEGTGQEKAGDKDRSQASSFFRVPTYLTVSGQLHLEVMTGAFTKVYTFNPTFRAEKSPGRHHLSEFYMLEAELAFIHTQHDLMQVIETLIKTVTERLLDTQADDMNLFIDQVAGPGHKQVITNLAKGEYVRVSYTEAISILEQAQKKFQFCAKWGSDLQKEHERHLVAHCGNMPVFVTDFPASLKPFYARVNNDGKTVAAVDLLGPDVGELCGGSLREERLDHLEQNLASLGLTDDYQWYMDLRRFGSVPHGGFGIGFERYLQALLGIKNIKETIPFPRFLHHCSL